MSEKIRKKLEYQFSFEMENRVADIILETESYFKDKRCSTFSVNLNAKVYLPANEDGGDGDITCDVEVSRNYLSVKGSEREFIDVDEGHEVDPST